MKDAGVFGMPMPERPGYSYLLIVDGVSGKPRKAPRHGRCVFARAQTRYSPLRLLATCGRRSCDAARGDRGRRNAAHIDLRHRQIEEAQDGIGQLIVAAEAATQPMAPIWHAAKLIIDSVIGIRAK